MLDLYAWPWGMIPHFFYLCADIIFVVHFNGIPDMIALYYLIDDPYTIKTSAGRSIETVSGTSGRTSQ